MSFIDISNGALLRYGYVEDMRSYLAKSRSTVAAVIMESIRNELRLVVSKVLYVLSRSNTDLLSSMFQHEIDYARSTCDLCKSLNVFSLLMRSRWEWERLADSSLTSNWAKTVNPIW